MVSKIDITNLPEEARREIIDFYEYLLMKYGKGNNKIKENNRDESGQKEKFFDLIDKHSFKLPEGYEFNRGKLHER